MSSPPNSSRLILASASPRRQELLTRLGRPFRVEPASVPENIERNATAEQAAMALAEAKARAVAKRVRSGLIIGADTVVAVNGQLIGKPGDEADAKRILRLLSSRRHAVITGVCLMDAGSGRSLTEAARTWITMRPMSERDIADYVASGEPMGKAGAYAIQETGDRYVQTVEGSFTNVVGLPLELLTDMLKRADTWTATGKKGSHP